MAQSERIQAEQSPKFTPPDQSDPTQRKRGLAFKRYFTKPGVHPFDAIEWELRAAVISNEKGETIFEQKDVEIPKSWSMTATNVVVSKYFHGKLGSPERETSVRQVVERVSRVMTEWGRRGGYFASEEDGDTFSAELTFLLVNQYMSFNSPVWFNVGISEKPQCSACFINSVEDTMESILELAKTEGRLFKFGSGTGSNLSVLRSSKENLSSGGTASGPVSFMKGYDAFAGVIKSGGKTRRAAKMVILNIDHRVHEFVRGAHGMVRVLVGDGIVRASRDVEPARVARVDERPGLLLLLRFAADEIQDVGVVDVEDHHLGGAAGLAAGFDDACEGVVAPHERYRSRGRAAA